MSLLQHSITSLLTCAFKQAALSDLMPSPFSDLYKIDGSELLYNPSHLFINDMFNRISEVAEIATNQRQSAQYSTIN